MIPEIAALAGPVNTFDELRIIAKDAPLKSDDREVLRRAANELEEALRFILVQNAYVIETQQHFLAVNDQLLAARKQLKAFVDPVLAASLSPKPAYAVTVRGR